MEERMKILKMIEDGVVSAKEGLELLKSFDEDEPVEKLDIEKKTEGKYLVIKVDTEDGDKVNVRIPAALAKLGMKIGSKYTSKIDGIDGIEDIDLEEILGMVSEGATGELVDIQTEDGNVVKIYVE